MATNNADMKDKVCLITGATSGIGKATAIELARRGARVVIVARSRAGGEAAQHEIQEQSGNKQIDLLIADLSSQNDIRELAETFLQSYNRLDVLINNAGAVFPTRQVSSDCIEMTVAVNYVAPFLLTALLLDILKKSAPARIINVDSDAHRWGTLGDFQSKRRYGVMKAYGKSKFAELLWTYALARRLEGTGVTVNALHPGFVSTNLGQRGVPKPIASVLGAVTSRIGLSAEEGSETSVYLATSPEVANISGKYFDKCKPIDSIPETYNEERQERLWKSTNRLLNLPAS